MNFVDEDKLIEEEAKRSGEETIRRREREEQQRIRDDLAMVRESARRRRRIRGERMINNRILTRYTNQQNHDDYRRGSGSGRGI